VTTILLARHGETDWNRDRRWQGQADTPLNDRGREQARELAESIDRVDVIYASDLSRARETAEIVGAHHGVEVRTDPRLRERAFGAWEGLHDEEVERRFADEYALLVRGDGHGPADAEPYEALHARVSSFLDDVVRRHGHEHVLVVAHGGSLRVIHAIAGGLDYLAHRRSLPPADNCALSRCVVQDGKLTRLD
jgi:broad specificity phosphatase PhoE